MADDFDPKAFIAESERDFDPKAFIAQNTPGLPAEASRETTALDYPEIYAEENRAARRQMQRGLEQLTTPTGGDLSESVKSTVYGLGNVGLGAAGYVSSPIAAALRTFIGNPIQERTGVPREYTEFAAGLAIPGYGLRGLPGQKASIPALPPTKGLQAEAAAQEFIPSGLTKGQATGDLEAIRTENLAARGALGKEAQDMAAARFNQQAAEAQQSARDVGETLSRGKGTFATPAEGAAVLKGEVGDVAERARGIVTRAEEGAAAEARALEEGIETQRQGLAARRQGLSADIQGAHPALEAPREAGEMVAEGVRGAAQRGRAEYGRLYDEVAEMEGTFRPAPFVGMGDRIGLLLTNSDNPVLIDAANTPRAAHALRLLDDLPNLRLPSTGAGGETLATGAPMDLRGVDRGRKQLTSLYTQARIAARSNAPNAASDARALGRIINEYDDTIERAISNGLFSGDPAALDALQAARGAYARYAQTFRPQGAGDDVGQAIRRIVDRNATPEEVANMIIGSGRIGTKGLPVRIADRLEQILGPHSQEWNSIQQGILQSTTARTAAGEINPLRTAQNIAELSTSSLGRRMFTRETLDRMRDYAAGVQGLTREMADLPTRQAQLPSRQAAERLRGTYQEVFGGEGIGGSAQRVFQRIVDGSATPEEIVNATFNVINAKTAGSAARFVDSVARVTGENSASMAAVRQGVWQRLTQNALGKDQPGAQKLAQSINEFLNGSGQSIAKKLYNQTELELMQRYATIMKQMVVPRFAQTGSDTAPAMLQMLRHLSSSITSHLLSHVPVVRHVAPLVPFVAKRSKQAREVEKLRQSLEPVRPATPPVKRPNLLRPALVPSDREDRMASGGLLGASRVGRLQEGGEVPPPEDTAPPPLQGVDPRIQQAWDTGLLSSLGFTQSQGILSGPADYWTPGSSQPEAAVSSGISIDATGAPTQAGPTPLLQSMLTNSLAQADAFGQSAPSDPRVDAFYQANPGATLGDLWQAVPDAGRGSPLGGIGTLHNTEIRDYYNDLRSGATGSTDPSIASIFAQSPFYAGQDAASTNNWQLLPPMYRQPGMIARNGVVINPATWASDRGFAAGMNPQGGPSAEQGNIVPFIGFGTGAPWGYPGLLASGYGGWASVGWPGSMTPWLPLASGAMQKRGGRVGGLLG